jgi:sugar transferase (PEP-CTERM/EpsH1 system associated)
MIHVVHVVPSLETGGMQNGVVNLVHHLGQEARHSVVSVAGPGPMATRLPPSCAVVPLAKRPGRDWRTVVSLVAALRRLRPDVVHSRNWGAFDAVLAARLAGVRVVVHGEHGRVIEDLRGDNRRRNRLRRALAPLVTRFVTVSSDLAAWLVGTVGISRTKVVTIPNGVDTDRFAPGDGAALRRALALPAGGLVVGAIGRLDPVKDHLALLEAFARLVPVPDVVLVIAGEGPCRAALEARVGALGLDKRVRLLGERGDVPDLLRAMDVFVLSSIGEGVSNTVLEAMATGLPVVATRVGGTPELVIPGVTGLLVPAGDAGALADALATYAGDPALRRRHGGAGRRRAVEQFGLRAMADGYRALYLALAHREVA